MKTIQPSMWLLLNNMVMAMVVMMMVMVMVMAVNILPNVASFIVKTQDCAEAFLMASES